MRSVPPLCCGVPFSTSVTGSHDMPTNRPKHTSDPGAASAALGASGNRIIVVYERVSTEAQDLTQQAVQRERAAADYPEAELVAIQDDGVSAYKVSVFDRPGGRELCDLIGREQVAAVYADAQDRLSRGKQSEWWQFVDLCELTSTRIIIDGREIKPWEDEGDEIKSALDQMIARRESTLKSHRTRGGVARIAAAGRVNGGPRRYGFEPTTDGQLTPRPAEVAVVAQMFELARAGKSQLAIARELNDAGHRTAGGHLWSQPKVGQVLKNSIWVGKLVNAQGTFQIMEPLIDPELWAAVARTLSTDGKRRGRHSQRFLLANGLLRCGCCGSKLSVRRAETPAGVREHYRCMGRRSGATECKQPDVPREPIDTAVLAYFEQVALDVTGTVEQLAGERDRRLAECDAKLAQARKVQAEAERQLERLDGLLRDEGMTLDEWRRVAAVPQSEAEAAAGAIADVTAEREQVEATLDIADATGEFMERITALRSTVAGEINSAEGIAATQASLRRVFDGFVLHRGSAPEAPRWVNAELMVGASYVLEPRVSEDARLGALPAGTPVVKREPLALRKGGCKGTGSPGGTAGGRAVRPTRRTASRSASRECLLEVGPERVGILEPDRQAEEPGRDAVPFPARACLDSRGDAAEARAVLDQAGGGFGAARGIGVGDVEREQAAEPRVANGLDGRMGIEALDDRRGALGLACDPHLQGREPAEEKPRDVGRRDRPGVRAELAHARLQLGISEHERADERVVVAREELRRRMKHDVAAALERPDVEGSGGRRVAENGGPVPGGGVEVRHRQERIRRRFEPDQVDVGRRRSRLVVLDMPEPPSLQLAQQRARPVVRAFGDRHRPAGLEQREHDGSRRRRSRREEEGGPAVEGPERSFRFCHGRAREACVRELAGLTVLVGPGRRAVERRARHAGRIRRASRSVCGSRAGKGAHASSFSRKDARNMSLTALRFTWQTSHASFAMLRPEAGSQTSACSLSTSSRSQNPQRSSVSRWRARTLASRER
jgi:site-specific DNA recombinase